MNWALLLDENSSPTLAEQVIKCVLDSRGSITCSMGNDFIYEKFLLPGVGWLVGGAKKCTYLDEIPNHTNVVFIYISEITQKIALITELSRYLERALFVVVPPITLNEDELALVRKATKCQIMEALPHLSVLPVNIPFSGTLIHISITYFTETWDDPMIPTCMALSFARLCGFGDSIVKKSVIKEKRAIVLLLQSQGKVTLSMHVSRGEELCDAIIYTTKQKIKWRGIPWLPDSCWSIFISRIMSGKVKRNEGATDFALKVLKDAK